MTDEPTPGGALAEWLVGAGPDHPLSQPKLPHWLGGSMEEILASLDAVAPLRIAQKCDAFRKVKTFDAFHEQRAELLAASLLARAEIDFEFGRDRPDLEVDGGAWGIEVGTRKLDHPWLIHDLLEERLSDRADLHVVLTFDGRPLGLGAKQVTGIVDAIAPESYPNGRSNRRFENAGFTVAVMTGTGVPESQVVLDFGARSGSELTGITWQRSSARSTTRSERRNGRRVGYQPCCCSTSRGPGGRGSGQARSGPPSFARRWPKHPSLAWA